MQKESRWLTGYTPLGLFVRAKLAKRPRDESTQEWLAKALGINGGTLGRYLKGDYPLTVDLLAKMAEMLEVDPLELAGLAMEQEVAGRYHPRVKWVADTMQQLVDELPEDRAAEVLDQVEGMVRLLRGVEG
jgi:transcriptional regulator with XRE-family HTH domain